MKIKHIFQEASGGPEITGQYAPTNQLLKPEFEPKQARGNIPKDDEHVDKSRLELDTVEQLGDMADGGDAAQYNLDTVPAGSEKARLLKRLNIKRINSQIPT